MNAHALAREAARRKVMWESVIAAGGPNNVAPTLLRELGIYGGAQGIWVNKQQTIGLVPGNIGVTVGLLHTGEVYDDDLSDEGVIYHYPATNRPPGRDMAEISATKAVAELGLPVFVITHSQQNPTLRNVRLAWVETWDDASKTFAVSFGDQQPDALDADAVDALPFESMQPPSSGLTLAKTRLGQPQFKFRVFQRYGPSCAVCGLSVGLLLDAAHIRPRRANGSDDPRNGLVLCALHHRAMDVGFFAVEPATLLLRTRTTGPDRASLRIAYASLDHLVRKPHTLALEWLWDARSWWAEQGT